MKTNHLRSLSTVLACPGCGFRLFEKLPNQLSLPMPCPACSEHSLSDFVPIGQAKPNRTTSRMTRAG